MPQMLIRLKLFFDLCMASKWHDAWQVVSELGLLPTSGDHHQLESMVCIRPDPYTPLSTRLTNDVWPRPMHTQASKFLSLQHSHHDVQKNFHSVLLKAMECLFRIYEERKRQAQGRYTSEMLADQQRGKVLVTFANSPVLAQHMPPETRARLTRYEAQMGFS